jgi:hypothetical protein
MKKVLLGLVLVLGTFVGNAQTKTPIIIGATAGNGFGPNYGAWVDFGHMGIEYSYGVGLSGDDPTDFINGKAKSYNAGSYYRNYGFYTNDFFFKGSSFGAGAQVISDITTSGIITKTLPYFNLGYNIKLNEDYVVKLNGMVGNISSFNIGVGYILK